VNGQLEANTNNSIFNIKNLPKLIVVVLAITIICLLFPKHEQSQKIEYQVGQNWDNNDLFSDRDFTASVQKPFQYGVDSLVTSQVTYLEGNLIIYKGQYVSDPLKQTIDQYFEGLKNQKSFIYSSRGIFYFLGYFILTALILGALIFFALKFFTKDFNSVKGIGFLVFWPVVFSLISFSISNANGLSPYLIPFCVAPIVILNFYDGKLALIIHIVVVLLSSFISGQGYEFTFLQILVGLVTVLIVNETRYWNKFFIAILIILGTYILGHLGLALINSGSIANHEYNVFMWLSINALLLLLAYPLIPLVEKIFGFTSTITLAELSDMNKPLLKELSIKAPGTLQHSIQVANLCESAAVKIGANGLLVKTAALYHDIGKIANPYYYIENTKGENPHSSLSNFESAKMIIDHVVEGEKMAKKAKLPQVLIDFITTHHGTTRVEYFYRNQKTQEPNREFDETLFRYPGPNPKTKEQTILMIADSIEAASKSLKNPTGLDIDKLVDGIVDHKIKEHQLTDSELSFSELEICIAEFKSLLRSIYHVRIEYPAENQTTSQQ